MISDAALHDHPVFLTCVCFTLVSLFVFATDRYALPADARLKYRITASNGRLIVETVARLLVIAWVFLFFFLFSWRPIYAAQATASFFVIFTMISRLKFLFIREPLLFSDIALVADVFKYKSIFYATKFNIIFWFVAVGYVFGASFAYMLFEPHVLPSEAPFLWAAIAVVAFFAPVILVFIRFVGRRVARCCEKLLKTIKVRPNTVRFGTFSTVVFHFLIWLGMNRDMLVENMSKTVHRVIHDLIEGEHDEAPLLLIWQSESFYDLRHMGDNQLQLPTLDRLRERAIQRGRLTNVFEGGYTLRTEFAVLSGLQPDDVHADASYPYLRASHYTNIVWPTKLLRNDWKTFFIHPYDRTFFVRHKAMPLLGFERMIMLDEFEHDPETQGPYVSDHALTEKVLETIDSLDPQAPAMMFVASMANHGPWEAGRCEGMTNSVDIYRKLLSESDAALEILITKLESSNRPVWLAFYGDHAPLLKEYADPFPDPRTDYFIVPLGKAHSDVAVPTTEREVAPWNLFETLLIHAKLSRERFS